jgi:hypothetical protein
MHSAKLTIAKFSSVLFIFLGLHTAASAQENSPYSRYGLGDLTPNHNIFTRGMGGISAATNDNRSINFTNPASLANLGFTIFDIGAEVDIRTLRSSSPADKFTSANTYFSYLQIGFPLTTPKMAKKDMSWGMSFGIKPVSKINYKIEKNERLSGIDSLNTIYEGNGGVNQASIGSGLKIKNFSIGFNAGYMFGSKDYSTKLTFINDSTFYYLSNSENKTTFGGFFINGGMQYDIALARDEKNPKIVTKNLRIGLYGNMQQNLRANSDNIREIIFYDPNGGYYRIDSVFEDKDVKGKIKFPAMVGFGMNYQGKNWMFGADFEYGNWNAYRYYGQSDAVKNNWTIRAGAQYYPNKGNSPVVKYFNFVKYRAGLFYGPDYISVNKNRPEYGFTIGTGMPLTSLKKISYTGEFVMLNTALEIGNRGNKQTNLRENVVRISIGVSMNASWFQKRKYY